MSIKLTASDLYSYFQPSPCPRRVYLKQIGKGEVPPSPYEEILIRLGEKHEASHLAGFAEWADLSEGDLDEREHRRARLFTKAFL